MSCSCQTSDVGVGNVWVVACYYVFVISANFPFLFRVSSLGADTKMVIMRLDESRIQHRNLVC